MKPQLRHTGAKVALKGRFRFEKGMPLYEEFGTDRMPLVLVAQCRCASYLIVTYIRF